MTRIAARKVLLSVVEHGPLPPDGRLGPPYSVPEADVRGLFEESFEVTALDIAGKVTPPRPLQPFVFIGSEQFVAGVYCRWL